MAATIINVRKPKIFKLTIIFVVTIVLVTSTFLIYRISTKNFEKVLSYPSSFIKFENNFLSFYYPSDSKVDVGEPTQITDTETNSDCTVQDLTVGEIKIRTIRIKEPKNALACESFIKKPTMGLGIYIPSADDEFLKGGIFTGLESFDGMRFLNYRVGNESFSFTGSNYTSEGNYFYLISTPNKDYQIGRNIISTLITNKY